MQKPLKENIEIALKLLKILLKELERVLGRNTFAERVNKLTEDEPKLNGLAGNLDKNESRIIFRTGTATRTTKESKTR